MTVAAWPRCRKGPSSRPDACPSAGTGFSGRLPSSSRTFFPGAACAAAAMLLALPCAPALAADGPEAAREIAYPEGAVAGVLSLPADTHSGTPSDDWHLSGPDAARFRIEAGALRFAAASRLRAPSAATTTASRSSSVPGSRAARQSGRRLMVVWLSRQYQRGTFAPGGVFRA